VYYKFNSESPNIKLTNATAESLSYTGSEDIKSLEHQDPAAVDESSHKGISLEKDITVPSNEVRA